MTDVVVEYRDAVHCKIRASPDIMMEMSSYFTFFAPGYAHVPSYKAGFWDGKIRLLNPLVGLIYTGLRARIAVFCEKRGYTYAEDGFLPFNKYTDADVNDFVHKLGLPTDKTPRYYQVEALTMAVNVGRLTMLSPTGSGKSLIAYLLSMWHGSERVLIIVPRKSLVCQMQGDFREYGCTERVHALSGGADKDDDARMVVSTWQSIYKLPKEWFDRFSVVIGDECHLFQAKSLVSIMSKMPECSRRFGFTGTLSEADDKTGPHRLVLEGLFGPVYRVATTAGLMEEEYLSSLTVRAMLLRHPHQARALLGSTKYPDEMDYLVGCPARNRFIKELVRGLRGNTLVLTQFVKKHGQVLYDLIDSDDFVGNRPVFFVHGGVDVDDREAVRAILETETDAVVIATYGVMSLGVNMPNLSNAVFASPYKSRITNLQSLGRVVRRTDTKTTADLYDIGDDLGYAVPNHTLRHFGARIKLYEEEKFPYRVYDLKLQY